jgi:hypothetical protein
MRKMKNVLGGCILALALLLVGCNKEETFLNKDVTEQEGTSQKGMLTFRFQTDNSGVVTYGDNDIALPEENHLKNVHIYWYKADRYKDDVYDVVDYDDLTVSDWGFLVGHASLYKKIILNEATLNGLKDYGAYKEYVLSSDSITDPSFFIILANVNDGGLVSSQEWADAGQSDVMSTFFQEAVTDPLNGQPIKRPSGETYLPMAPYPYNFENDLKHNNFTGPTEENYYVDNLRGAYKFEPFHFFIRNPAEYTGTFGTSASGLIDREKSATNWAFEKVALEDLPDTYPINSSHTWTADDGMEYYSEGGVKGFIGNSPIDIKFRRLVARFDIVNDAAASSFTITGIRITKAQQRGYLFQQNITSSWDDLKLSATSLFEWGDFSSKNLTGDTYITAANGLGEVNDKGPNDNGLHPAVFYLYPTDLTNFAGQPPLRESYDAGQDRGLLEFPQRTEIEIEGYFYNEPNNIRYYVVSVPEREVDVSLSNYDPEEVIGRGKSRYPDPFEGNLYDTRYGYPILPNHRYIINTEPAPKKEKDLTFKLYDAEDWDDSMVKFKALPSAFSLKVDYFDEAAGKTKSLRLDTIIVDGDDNFDGEVKWSGVDFAYTYTSAHTMTITVTDDKPYSDGKVALIEFKEYKPELVRDYSSVGYHPWDVLSENFFTKDSSVTDPFTMKTVYYTFRADYLTAWPSYETVEFLGLKGDERSKPNANKGTDLTNLKAAVKDTIVTSVGRTLTCTVSLPAVVSDVPLKTTFVVRRISPPNPPRVPEWDNKLQAQEMEYRIQLIGWNGKTPPLPKDDEEDDDDEGPQ